jgi:predicted phage tail protein
LILNRQKIVGWVLIAVGAAYLAYFWRVRLMASGAPIGGKEWFNLITCGALLMIGTINVRLAARRERNRLKAGPEEQR